MDRNRAIRMAVETGKVLLGIKETEEAFRSGNAKLVILASNCPSPGQFGEGRIRVLRYEGDSAQLGAACGRPFSVSAMAILDQGESNVLSM